MSSGVAITQTSRLERSTRIGGGCCSMAISNAKSARCSILWAPRRVSVDDCHEEMWCVLIFEIR